jgi:PAS domain S-box-containing protein
MAVLERPSGYALADLALALNDASAEADAVLATAVRAAAAMLGDGVGIQLLTDECRYDSLVFHHPDDRLNQELADALDRVGATPEDEFSTAMRATRRPIGLERIDDDMARRLAVRPGPVAAATAAALCPLIVDDTFQGYLIAVRTEPDATYRPADIDLARDIAGELALALSTVRSRQRLRAAEQRYRQILEGMPEGVLQLDAQGCTTYANEPMGVMLGLPRHQLAGLSLRGFLDDRGQAEMARRLADCQAGRATIGGTRLVRADGSTRSARISMMPLTEEHGEPDGVLCLVTDTTDHIDARGLKRQLDHLRRLDSLSQLIGGLSHDFNNLLTVVQGNAEMITADAEPGSQQHQQATAILHATLGGRSLIHQLLAFGRTDGNRTESIPVADLFGDMQPLFSRILGEHVGLDLTFGPDVWNVRAERGPLEQALVNLAANARDAMLHGGVLRVTAANVHPGEVDDPSLQGRFVHLAISDTGAGMPEEVRCRAFEPFFTTKATGAGLGLATALGIVRACGGGMTLQSRPKMGTTVHLYLPAADPAPADRPAPPAAATVGHVLVVEDQLDVAQLVQRFVQHAGYEVTVTTDAREAVAAVAAGAPCDLLITDVVMPAMTGPELAAALRGHRPDLPVVYMSGYTAAALGPQVTLDDRSLMVEKPFQRSTLVEAIRRLSGA